jgi:hypothetical protein
MKRLKTHLTPSTAIAFIALVFAVTGVSFAATGGSGNSGGRGSGGRGSNLASVTHASAAKAKPKAKTGPRGPAGKNGAPGATGPAGPAGPGGPAGPTGPAGGAGPQGPAGPTGNEGPIGHEGKEGKPGKTGFTKTLPAGATETGAWSVEQSPTGEPHSSTAISFSIPLETALGEGAAGCLPAKTCPAEFVTLEEQKKEHGLEPPAACKGTAAAPTAEAGHICVYAALESLEFGGLVLNPFGSNPAKEEFITGTATAGAELYFVEKVNGFGTWAVTAE